MGNTIGKAAVVDFGIQWIGWMLAASLQTEKFFDLTGSVTNILLTLMSLQSNKSYHIRQKLNSGMVLMWAARLGLFLFSRILRDGKDSRFDKVRHNPKIMFIFWTIQGVWVLLTLLPVLIVNYKKDNRPVNREDQLGWGLWILGFLIEVIADHQKTQFRKDPANAEKFITSGLWSISRHPNYFGEILMWLGIYISSRSTFRGWEHIGAVSPFFITFLLTKMSGIPLLEAAGKKKWGTDPAYIAYKKNTACLVPFIW
ncbi:steroid reductase [Elysia marginata]|uniref:Steroid reductase n=1 Tax=Elysia marginata TaxID=1093978 RepID=A0AAV4H301_9GAST|nr:steroid reductase [Elysia marginata]